MPIIHDTIVKPNCRVCGKKQGFIGVYGEFLCSDCFEKFDKKRKEKERSEINLIFEDLRNE